MKISVTLRSVFKYPCGVNVSPRLSEDVLVEALLSAGETTLQDVLVLLGQLLLHVSFRAPQDERLDHLQVKSFIC